MGPATRELALVPFRLDGKLKLNVPTGDFSQVARLAYETTKYTLHVTSTKSLRLKCLLPPANNSQGHVCHPLL